MRALQHTIEAFWTLTGLTAAQTRSSTREGLDKLPPLLALLYENLGGVLEVSLEVQKEQGGYFPFQCGGPDLVALEDLKPISWMYDPVAPDDEFKDTHGPQENYYMFIQDGQGSGGFCAYNMSLDPTLAFCDNEMKTEDLETLLIDWLFSEINYLAAYEDQAKLSDDIYAEFSQAYRPFFVTEPRNWRGDMSYKAYYVGPEFIAKLTDHSRSGKTLHVLAAKQKIEFLGRIAGLRSLDSVYYNVAKWYETIRARNIVA